MEIGYSIILGELVPASELTHADTSDHLIICPICKEPVVKVERLCEEGNRIAEFLRHLKKTDFSRDCELRVASMSAEQENAKAGIRRGQNKAVFDKKFKEIILKSVHSSLFRDIPQDVINTRSFKDLMGIALEMPDTATDFMFRRGIRRHKNKYLRSIVNALIKEPDIGLSILERDGLRDVAKVYPEKSDWFRTRYVEVMREIIEYMIQPAQFKLTAMIFALSYEYWESNFSIVFERDPTTEEEFIKMGYESKREFQELTKLMVNHILDIDDKKIEALVRDKFVGKTDWKAAGVLDFITTNIFSMFIVFLANANLASLWKKL